MKLITAIFIFLIDTNFLWDSVEKITGNHNVNRFIKVKKQLYKKVSKHKLSLQYILI